MKLPVKSIFIALLLGFSACEKSDSPVICETTVALPVPQRFAQNRPKTITWTQFASETFIGWSYTERLNYEFTKSGWLRKVTQKPIGSNNIRETSFRYADDSIIVDLIINSNWTFRDIYIHDQQNRVLEKTRLQGGDLSLIFRHVFAYNSDGQVSAVALHPGTGSQEEVRTLKVTRSGNRLDFDGLTVQYLTDQSIHHPWFVFYPGVWSGPLEINWGFDPLLHPNFVDSLETDSIQSRYEYLFDDRGRVITFGISGKKDSWVTTGNSQVEFTYFD